MGSPSLGDFTQQAAAYARSRPGYPEQLLDLLVADLALGYGDPVAEIGAGTGIFTRQLAARGLVVTALEPNLAMGQQAPTLLRVAWHEGTFEETGLVTASQCWVVAAQAFHWADPARALPELARVLLPGRSFTALWNDRRNEASEILSWTHAALRRVAPAHDLDYRKRNWAEVLTSTGDFENVRTRFVDHVVTMDRARYLDLWRSHNRLRTQAGDGALATFIRELGDHLEREHIEIVEVPYRTQAWTARKSR